MSEMGKPLKEQLSDVGDNAPRPPANNGPPPPPGPGEDDPDGTEELLPDQHISGTRKQRHSSGPPGVVSAPATSRIASKALAGVRLSGRPRKPYGTATDEETESLYEDEAMEDPAPLPQPPNFSVPTVRLRPGSHYKPLSDNEAYPYPIVIHLGQSPDLGFSHDHSFDNRSLSESPHLSRIAQRRNSEMSFESVDNGSAWQDEYRHRPSWCDATAALRQVQKGQAKGFKPALWTRGLMQKVLFRLGCFIQRYPVQMGLLMAAVLAVWCIGLKDVSIQTDIVKLWVPQGGRLEQELNFLNDIKAKAAKNRVNAKLSNSATGGIGRRKREAENETVTTTPPAKTTPATRKVSQGKSGESGGGGGFQVVIQTPRQEGDNLLTREDLLLHAQVLTEVAQMNVSMYGYNWTLADICFKPPAPKVDLGLFTDVVQDLLDRIIPCIFITPLDCFWDGAKPLGPFPPIDVPEFASALVPSLPPGSVTWKNLNPHEVIQDIDEVVPLGDITTLFDRAGIYAAYQDRPCLDPLDPECPSTAPNYIDLCPLTEEFVAWNNANGSPVTLHKTPVPEDEKVLMPEVENVTAEAETDSYYDYYGEDGTGGVAVAESAFVWGGAAVKTKFTLTCRRYATAVLHHLRTNPDSILQGLKKNVPKKMDLGEEITQGCNGFASEILNWPEEMIVGGLEHAKNAEGRKVITRAQAFQSVMMVASNSDLYLRYNEARAGKQRLKGWSEGMAGQIIAAWQRNFTEMLYNYPNNTDEGTLRQIHPLASTSIGDMLDEFSKFNFLVIFIGYFLMLCYAGLCLGSWRERGVQSCAGLGVAGVLLVTYASVAGLGASTWWGIEFNAATTQIVPFLTLGLGVDDMFLLVHSYADTIRGVNHNEIGHLLKETGLSVLLTSVNNICSFAVGGLLPVPALRSFCFQTAILLFFNMIAIITLFPAIISLDLMRRKSKRVDILCCLTWKDKVIPTHDQHKGPVVIEEGGERPPSYNDAMRNGNGVTNLNRAKSVSMGTSISPLPSGLSRVFHNLNLEHFVSYHYGPFLERPLVKVCVMSFFAVLLGIGGLGVSRIRLGLELTDVIPGGTAPYDFLVAREKHFSFYPMFGVIKGPIDFPNKQTQIHEYQRAFTQISFIVKNQGKTGDMYWLQMMEKWLFLLQEHYNEDVARGYINGSIIEKKASDEGKLAYRLICQHKYEVDCSRNGEVSLLETIFENGVNVSVIRRDAFYNYLTAWVKLDNMMYYVTQADFFPVPPTDWDAPANKYDVLIPPASPPQYSQIPFFVNGLKDTEVTVVALKQVRAICDQFDENGLPNFPQGIPFTFWDQYLHIVKNLLQCIGFVVLTVFCVITVLILSPWSACCIVFVVICCIIELAGFMGLVGLKLNAVSAVSLVTAVGIGVEFTVHISLSFLTNMGDRNERMQATLDHMFIPVIHGGISTLLGIIMLAFSEFEFIVLYFFMVMSALIIIGLLNGLIFLPVLLCLVGPWSEVRSVDGTDMVPPPSPKTVKRQIAETGTGHHGGGPPTELSQMGGRRSTRGSTGARPESLSTIEEERGDGALGAHPSANRLLRHPPSHQSTAS